MAADEKSGQRLVQKIVVALCSLSVLWVILPYLCPALPLPRSLNKSTMNPIWTPLAAELSL